MPPRLQPAPHDETPTEPIATVLDRLDRVDDRLDELGEEVAGVSVRVDALTVAIAGHGKLLGRIADGIDAVNARGEARAIAETEAATEKAKAEEERSKFAALWWARLATPQGTLVILALIGALLKLAGVQMPSISFGAPGSAQVAPAEEAPLPPLGGP